MNNLDHIRAVVTRPHPHGDELRLAIENEGGTAFVLPAQEIVPDTEQVAQFAEALNSSEPCIAIFSSRNAVSAVAETLRKAVKAGSVKHCRFAAVGAGTAQELEKAGIDDVIYPRERFSAADLLALPEMADLNDSHVFLVSGHNPRDTLANAFAEHSRVQSFFVYRRENRNLAVEELEKAIAKANVLLGSNEESLLAVVENTPSSLRPTLFNLQCLCVSQRVAGVVSTLGFDREPVVIHRVDTDSWLSALHLYNGQLLTNKIGSEGMSDIKTETDKEPTQKTPSQDDAVKTGSQIPDQAVIKTQKKSTAQDEPTEAVKPAPKKSAASAWALFLAFLTFLLLVAACAFGGWQFLQLKNEVALNAQHQADTLYDQQQPVAQIQKQQRELKSLVSEINQTSQRRDVTIERLDAQQDEIIERLEQLNSSERAADRVRQLSVIQGLLLTANERVQLAGDVASAEQALALADARLAALKDARFFKVREQIAAERAALAAYAQLDINAAALSLSGLSAQVKKMPLRQSAATGFSTEPTADQPAPEGARWYEVMYNSVKSAVSSAFVVRRTEDVTAPLLSPEQERLTRALLELRLESAKIALIKGNAILFVNSVDSAKTWLEQQFDMTNNSVIAAHRELSRLAALNVAAELPDISNSQAMLIPLLEPIKP